MIQVELSGGVATLTMDDGKANAMNFDFFESLHAALDRAEAGRASALVFRGRPGFFSGGLDLKLIPTLTPVRLRALAVQFGRAILRVHGLPVPTLALCQGHAIAGGAILALACDARLAVDGPGRFHLNEVAIGIPLPSWAILVAGSTIPAQWRNRLLLQARPLDWRQCADIGLVDALISPEADLEARLRTAAAELQVLDRAAFALTRRRMREADIQGALSLLEGELDDQIPSL